MGEQATQALFNSKVPAGQGVQEDEFREEVKPGGHKVQIEEPSAEKVPGMHVWHILEPDADEIVPARHVMQDRPLEGLKEPAGHGEHTGGLLPEITSALPGLQTKIEQLEDPSKENEFALQREQVEKPSAGTLTENVLAGQSMH